MTIIEPYQDDVNYAGLFGSGTASAIFTHTAEPTGTYRAVVDIGLFSEEWTEPAGISFLVEYEDISRIDVIQQFASRLLSNLKDIDPAFARIAKEHFWDMI